MPKETVLMVYGIYLVAMSLITFFLYLLDKEKARSGAWRIRETTLLMFSILGGAFGGYPAMLIFRHKTAGEHWYFTAINWLGILGHGALLIAIAFFIPFAS